MLLVISLAPATSNSFTISEWPVLAAANNAVDSAYNNYDTT